MARPPKWYSTLDASIADACLAVRLYNDPAEPRCFEAFTVHMNRFEHRHASADAPLVLAVAGHAHALLVNYEAELTTLFGPERSLATRLRFPVFVGTFSPSGEQALRRLRKTLPRDLQSFLTPSSKNSGARAVS